MAICWTLENSIGTITLDNPPANILKMEFFSELADHLEMARCAPDLKAIILTGRGRHFSSGADVAELLEASGPETMLRNYRALAGMADLAVPVIAAIRGVCLGAAFELALHCHFRFGSADAVVGLPESNYNLMPGIGGLERMAGLTGKARALELILRGSTMDARDAYERGLLDAIFPRQELLPAAIAFALSLPHDINPGYRELYLHKYLPKDQNIERT